MDFKPTTSTTKQSEIPRFSNAQKDRSFYHPLFPQPNRHNSNNDYDGSSSMITTTDPPHETYCFVVAADTQLGMTHGNTDWEKEKEYSRAAVEYMNQMNKRPLFCCVCGDLVDMTAEIYASRGVKDIKDEGKIEEKKWTREECDRIQDQQNADFQTIWSDLHPDIALVCVCGNHDVGNRPTPASIERFRSAFGDDYFSFWVKDSYNIIVNTSLFSDSGNAPELFQEQWDWLEDRLRYAAQQPARHIFVFGHHPWFLYHEDEDEADMKGFSPNPSGGPDVKDSYFVIPRTVRRKVLALFAKYKVTAALAGHFHQNLVSKTSFGMHMIVTSSLSMVLQSTGIPKEFHEPRTRGIRIFDVNGDKFAHQFITI
ncbi:hypothetical protein ACA910_016213 [Epithemia clementina (nom. ined.)]